MRLMEDELRFQLTRAQIVVSEGFVLHLPLLRETILPKWLHPQHPEPILPCLHCSDRTDSAPS